MRTTFRKRSLVTRVLPLLIVAGAGAACTDFSTSRTVPERGTVGEDLYGILCDRVAAQVLREDLNGSSFAAICHKPKGGQYANEVDLSRLPPIDETLLDTKGQPVSKAQQEQWRNYALARINAMVRRRDALIAAFDATFPDVRIPVVDEKNGDATKSCNLLDDTDKKAGDRAKLTQQLSDMLGKLQALYNDGTIPRTTQAVAGLMDDIRATDDNGNATRTGLAQFDSRRGYKPEALEQGALRPVVAYPKLRDLSNAALRLLSWDSDPYAENAPRYGDGTRIPVPGPAHAQFSKMLEVTHEELRTFTPDPWAPAPASSTDAAGRPIISRPRTTLEVVDYLMKMQDPIFALKDDGKSDPPLYLVTRDSRGYASVPLVGGVLPAPFTPDGKNPSLPALDNLGQFMTSGGVAPSPFPAVDGNAAKARDEFGRALLAAGGAPVYGSIDTSQTFANALMKNLPPLIDPDVSKKHETLMDLIAGLEVLMGSRDGGYNSTRDYRPDPKRVDDWKLTHPGQEPPPDIGTKNVTVNFDSFHRDSAALLDLIWAVGVIAGDPSGDDVLSLVQTLLKDKLPTIARLTGTGLALKAIADKHPEAKIPATSTLWDEILDQLVEVEKEPQLVGGKTLLEDLLESLANDQVAGLGPVFSNQMKYSDYLTYDPDNINASPARNPPAPLYNETLKRLGAPQTLIDRSKPDSGKNRSLFQRFAQLVSDAHGVTLCNKPGAIVHAKGTALGDQDLPQVRLIGLPIYRGKDIVECSFQKVDDLAKFFLDSIVHKANLFIRYDLARDGLAIPLLGNLSPASVDVLQKSSLITGFWASRDPYSVDLVDPGCNANNNCPFLATPMFLTRLQFFHRGDAKNPTTNSFVSDLLPEHVATSLCPERDVLPDDPCVPGNENGCMACENRYPGNAEICNGADQISKTDGARPKVHGLRQCQEGDWLDQRDDFTLYVTEQDNFFEHIKPLLVPFAARNREDIFIKLMEAFNRHWQTDRGNATECSADPKNPHYCTRDGASSYEPILVEQFVSDVLPMLHDTMKTLMNDVKVNRCTAIDPQTHKCTATESVSGFRILADGARTLLDPDKAKTRSVKNRDGSVQGLRNDGSKTPQVTPMYLMLQALNKFDASFADWNAKHPNDDRLVLWRRARSQLVDQFLTVNGTATASAFANRVTPPLLPRLVQLFREQLLANCPDTFSTKSAATCAWAREEMTKKLGDVTSGPLFGTILDVTEAVRQDSSARSELAKLLLYMTDPASVNEARNTMLTTLVDFPQLLADDSLTPLIRTLATGAAASLNDEQGKMVRTGVVDAVTALLARLSGRAFTAEGVENCGRELDPNQVLTIALQNLVKPMASQGGKTPQTPLEVIIDAIADVNRVAPDEYAAKLQAPDYGSMMKQMSEFMLDKERGLEQFYEIIRLGTVGLPN